MPSPFKSKLISWALSASRGKPTIIWLSPLKFGGEAGAAKEARRITVSFGTMVAHERRKVSKAANKRGELAPLRTPYEDIICRSYPSPRGGKEVHFINDPNFFGDIYEELTPVEDTAPPTPEQIAEGTRELEALWASNREAGRVEVEVREPKPLNAYDPSTWTQEVDRASTTPPKSMADMFKSKG